MNRADINRRLAALASNIKRKKQEQEQLDPLSASLFAFEDELAALDEVGIAGLVERFTDAYGEPLLDMDGARQMVEDARKGAAKRRWNDFLA